MKNYVSSSIGILSTSLPKPLTTDFKADIEEKKKCVDETHKSIKTLEQDIQQKQNTVKCYKENVKRYV